MFLRKRLSLLRNVSSAGGNRLLAGKLRGAGFSTKSDPPVVVPPDAAPLPSRPLPLDPVDAIQPTDTDVTVKPEALIPEVELKDEKAAVVSTSGHVVTVKFFKRVATENIADLQAFKGSTREVAEGMAQAFLNANEDKYTKYEVVQAIEAHVKNIL